MKKKEEPQVFFTIKKVGDTWDVAGQLETRNMRDVLDIIMILLTNAVRVGLNITDIKRSIKPMEKAMTGQLKEIIKAEAKEARARLQEVEDERAKTSVQENAQDNRD